jgi:hypothetical protein
MESGSDGSLRETQRVSNLGTGQSDVVVHHENGPLFSREPAERSLELVAERHADLCVVG